MSGSNHTRQTTVPHPYARTRPNACDFALRLVHTDSIEVIHAAAPAPQTGWVRGNAELVPG